MQNIKNTRATRDGFYQYQHPVHPLHCTYARTVKWHWLHVPTHVFLLLMCLLMCVFLTVPRAPKCINCSRRHFFCLPAAVRVSDPSPNRGQTRQI